MHIFKFIHKQLLKFWLFIRYNPAIYNLKNIEENPGSIILANNKCILDKYILFSFVNNNDYIIIFEDEVDKAINLAKKSHVNIIPCYIKGEYKYNKLRVIFDEPINVANIHTKDLSKYFLHLLASIQFSTL